MTRHTDNAYVVCEIFAAELCTETETVCRFEKFLLKLDIAEGVPVFITLGGKIVIIFYRSFLDRGKVSFGRCAADHESDMIWRARGCAESLHLLDKERHKCLLVEDSLCFLIEIGLVG